MSFIHHFCITGKNYSFLKRLHINVILSGAINKDLTKFPTKWLKDSTGENISEKNINFGTLSSHYWFWKNKSPIMQNEDWIGFNHYWTKIFYEKYQVVTLMLFCLKKLSLKILNYLNF